MLFGLSGLPRALAQSTKTDWQKAAGEKMAFDVSSVKQNLIGYPPTGVKPHSNFPLDPGEAYSDNGGFFDATNWPAYVYVAFAYKLTSQQEDLVRKQLPKWATTDHFDIEGRAKGNPTKDQMRLMMQSLLADRFNAAAHFETRQGLMFDLVVANPGHLGLQMEHHSDELPCNIASRPESSPAGAGGSSAEQIPFCGELTAKPVSRHMEVSTRGMNMKDFASYIASLANVDRPVQDETGLDDTFDFTIKFSSNFSRSQQNDSDSEPPVFLQALQEQLGLKLIPTTGSITVLTIDRIEEPSLN
jgi:uncharacterized protein (TIGR03435 family)